MRRTTRAVTTVTPDDLGDHVRGLARAGATHLQLVLDPITAESIDVVGEALADLEDKRRSRRGPGTTSDIPDLRPRPPYIALMADILLGLLAIGAGGAMLLAGQFVLRLVFPIWGFFAGFAFGAGLVAEFADEHFLGSVLGWVLGLVFALSSAVSPTSTTTLPS